MAIYKFDGDKIIAQKRCLFWNNTMAIESYINVVAPAFII